MKIQLKNNNKIKTCFIQKIDDHHANPRKSWVEMGKPSSLSPAQVNSLAVTSAMVKEPHLAKQEKNWLVVEATLPAQGIAYITLELE